MVLNLKRKFILKLRNINNIFIDIKIETNLKPENLIIKKSTFHIDLKYCKCINHVIFLTIGKY